MMFRILITTTILCLLASCASQKAYEGENLPASELAVIYNSEKTEFEDGKLITLMEYVDDIHVGDAFRGFPTKVEVKPGEVTLRIGFREVSFGKSLAQGVLVMGGAVGGAVAGSINDDSEGLTKLSGIVEPGKSYIIKITSPTNSIKNIGVALEEN